MALSKTNHGSFLEEGKGLRQAYITAGIIDEPKRLEAPKTTPQAVARHSALPVATTGGTTATPGKAHANGSGAALALPEAEAKPVVHSAIGALKDGVGIVMDMLRIIPKCDHTKAMAALKPIHEWERKAGA